MQTEEVINISGDGQKPISVVVITYNRPEDMLELARNIAQLDSVSSLLHEFVIVNNASTSDYSAVQDYIASRPDLPFKYYDAGANLGVARGRNFALAKCSSPYLVMLDDDAVLQNKDCLEQVVAEFARMDTQRPKAVISFKVLYYDTLEMQKNALPHKKYKQYRDRSFFETYFYAGGAHAVRREVMEKLGNYPEDFFYGMEEYDLSYRILEAGYSIAYSDKIVMLHKESPLGRKPKKEKLRMMWHNKTVVAYRYLPRIYFFSTAVMWSLFYLRNTRFDLAGFFTGWRGIISIPRIEQRKTISEETMAYLRKVEARLWY